MTTLKRAWQRLTGASPGKTQADLAEKYTHFQALLSANNQVLSLMADMEEKLSGDYLFDLQYIRAAVSQLRQETGTLVDALNGLGANRYAALAEALDRISREVEAVLTHRREIPAAPLVIDFEDLLAGMHEVVGGKNANLGEVKNRVGLPVPAGFAISTHAYKVFLDHNHLTARLTELLGHWRLDDLDSLARVSEDLKQMILAARVPPELEAAIAEAYERLAARERRRPLVAMRSSAVGEDLTLTFAGQYATYLNVPSESLVSRYKDIVASLFTPRALFYYKNKGFKEEEMAMGVVVMPMVQARASGVLFTRQPDVAGPGGRLHQRGLGLWADTPWPASSTRIPTWWPTSRRGRSWNKRFPPRRSCWSAGPRAAKPRCRCRRNWSAPPAWTRARLPGWWPVGRRPGGAFRQTPGRGVGPG